MIENRHQNDPSLSEFFRVYNLHRAYTGPEQFAFLFSGFLFFVY